MSPDFHALALGPGPQLLGPNLYALENPSADPMSLTVKMLPDSIEGGNRPVSMNMLHANDGSFVFQINHADGHISTPMALLQRPGEMPLLVAEAKVPRQYAHNQKEFEQLVAPHGLKAAEAVGGFG